MTIKPVVRYNASKYDFVHVGMPALVHPIDHYNSATVSNTRQVRTSNVVRLTEGGFETSNTMYVRAK